jgi:hypothetical protein
MGHWQIAPHQLPASRVLQQVAFPDKVPASVAKKEDTVTADDTAAIADVVEEEEDEAEVCN